MILQDYKDMKTALQIKSTGKKKGRHLSAIPLSKSARFPANHSSSVTQD